MIQPYCVAYTEKRCVRFFSLLQYHAVKQVQYAVITPSEQFLKKALSQQISTNLYFQNLDYQILIQIIRSRQFLHFLKIYVQWKPGTRKYFLQRSTCCFNHKGRNKSLSTDPGTIILLHGVEFAFSQLQPCVTAITSFPR